MAAASASCWILLVSGVGNRLTQSAEEIEPVPKNISSLRKAARDAFKADLLARTSAGRLSVYPPGDTSLQNLLEPDVAVPKSSAKQPLLVVVPAGVCLRVIFYFFVALLLCSAQLCAALLCFVHARCASLSSRFVVFCGFTLHLCEPFSSTR